MPVAAPADKRFRRAHVSPARRRSWRERWFVIARAVVFLSLAGYGVYRAVDLAFSAEALTVTRIAVSGNSRMSKGEVLAVLDGLRGANLLTTDLDDWRRKLLASPWVSDATIRRVFPGTLSVTISERQPLGIGRINDGLYLVDQRATIIDEYGPNYAELDLPIIDGLASPSPKDALLIDEPRAQLAGRLLTELRQRPDLGKRISQIDVADVRDAVVILKGDTTLVRVGDERFVERIQSYLDLAPALRERVPAIDYVDLRFDERVYVRPVGSATKVQKTQEGRSGNGA
jgi:cell division septal protein FtsQ